MVEVLRPTRLAEALEFRAERAAVPFGGGTDLMVRLRRGAGVMPGFDGPVLFLDRVEELRGIRPGADGGLEVGAAASLSDLASHAAVHPLFRESLLSIGAPGLRNAATLAGNICNASPAADSLPFLYACEARLKLASRRGERLMLVEHFITGPGTTRLDADEIVVGILIPAWSPRHGLWRKVGTRRANALSKTCVAAFCDESAGRLSGVRIAVGAAAPTVVRLRAVEGMLEGCGLGEIPGREKEIRRAAAEAVRPIDDQRSTAEYRSAVAQNLVWRFAAGLSRRSPG
jgi:xanthine dehydrogenase FAD-binding subunit